MRDCISSSSFTQHISNNEIDPISILREEWFLTLFFLVEEIPSLSLGELIWTISIDW
jgi:hypothetical protein